MELLHCHHDSYCTELTVQVLDCQQVDGLHYASLNASIFYPGGGGQPQDIGELNGIPILSANYDGGYPVMVLGAPVELGRGRQTINWAHRFDLMQQHTGQHLLTAIALARFGWSTLAFHLNSLRSDIVLDTDSISDEHIEILEQATNAAIRSRVDVQPVMMPLEQIRNGGVRVGRLPDQVTGELRVVGIDGVDRNPCGGTHVKNLAELQMVRLLSVESSRGQSRLHFIFGDRVMRQHRDMTVREKNLNLLLSASPSEHLDAVQRLQLSEKKLTKTVRELQDAAADSVARQLLDIDEHYSCFYREGMDMNTLAKVAQKVQAFMPGRLFILAGGTNGAGVFIMVGSAEEVKLHQAYVLGHIGGRGGGRGGRVQGKAERPASVLDLRHKTYAMGRAPEVRDA